MRIVIIVLLLVGCKPSDNMHHTIYFYNNADYNIMVATSVLYPDTISNFGYTEIKSHSLRYLDEDDGYEGLFQRNSYKKVILFVKSSDENKLVKRYILTLDTLNSLKWTIRYP